MDESVELWSVEPSVNITVLAIVYVTTIAYPERCPVVRRATRRPQYKAIQAIISVVLLC